LGGNAPGSAVDREDESVEYIENITNQPYHMPFVLHHYTDDILCDDDRGISDKFHGDPETTKRWQSRHAALAVG
jgi:hypothetical protein